MSYYSLMTEKHYSTFEEYLNNIESNNLRDLISELVKLSLEVKGQILSFMTGDNDYSGSINVSGDEQLSLDIASHELFLQKLPKNLYYLLLGEETTPENITEGTGEYIVLGDFIDGSSIVRSRGPGGIVNIIDKNGTIQAALTTSYIVFTRFDLATEAGYIQFIHDGSNFRVLKDNLNISPSKEPVYGFGGSYDQYSKPQKQFTDGVSKKAKLRYGGCLVQDMNNIFDKTGVFGYFAPKLRLVYEILPYLYILSKIGGEGCYITKENKSVTLAEAPLLDVDKLTDMEYLHRKVGFVGGSKDLVYIWLDITSIENSYLPPEEQEEN